MAAMLSALNCLLHCVDDITTVLMNCSYAKSARELRNSLDRQIQKRGNYCTAEAERVEENLYGDAAVTVMMLNLSDKAPIVRKVPLSLDISNCETPYETPVPCL